MKLYINLLFGLFLACWNTNAQECAPSLATADFFPNNIKTRLAIGGTIWKNFYNIPADQPPLEDQASILFAGSIWLGGIDTEQNLHLAAGTYGYYGLPDLDFYPGPIDENGSAHETTCANFDRHFSVTRNQINNFKADYSADGYVDGSHAFIYRWPARGNPHFSSYYGFELPDQPLAPFVDHNGDGKYDPNFGDHPRIKGSQAVWWIYNDVGNIHAETEGEPVGAEIQMMAYAFDSEEENIRNSTFYDVRIEGKGGSALHDFYTALFVDGSLGCYTDDYVGCMPEENLVFTYNADAVDGTVGCQCDGGYPSYCEAVPLMGIKLLKGFKNNQSFELSGFSYYNNGGVGMPPLGTSDPNFATEYYNYMTGHWRDGTPLTEEGSGYNPNGGTPTAFAFLGNPADTAARTMCKAELPIHADRRMILRFGPFDFESGDVIDLSFAVLFVSEVPHPCPDVTPLIEAGQDAQAQFDEVSTNTRDFLPKVGLEIFPNPFNSICIIQLKDNTQLINQLQLFDATGTEIKVIQNIKAPQLEIKRDNLNAGIYFYRLQTTERYWAAGKIIVQ